MIKQSKQFKSFIEKHPDTNFKRYILKKARKDFGIYNRIDEEIERLKIASEIVALRRRHNLTQVQLAKKAQTSQSAIAQIEAGKRSPTTDTLIKIANSIGVQLNISFSKSSRALTRR